MNDPNHRYVRSVIFDAILDASRVDKWDIDFCRELLSQGRAIEDEFREKFLAGNVSIIREAKIFNEVMTKIRKRANASPFTSK